MTATLDAPPPQEDGALPPLVNPIKLSPKLLRQLGGSVVGLLLALVVAGLTDFETPLPVVALGSIIGITYGLLAVGLVLVYRSNRIINFAHGEVGAFAAAIFGLLTVKYGLPYYVILPLGLLVGAATGAAAEVGVVRRLR